MHSTNLFVLCRGASDCIRSIKYKVISALPEELVDFLDYIREGEDYHTVVCLYF